METGLFVLAAAILLAGALVFFALQRKVPLPPASDPRLDSVIAAQGEITGQFRQTIDAQGALQKALSDRLAELNTKLGETLTESATKTAETLGGIQTRLSVIDEAQKNITALSGEMISLKDILSNKQSRGAYGQAQMEAIIADALAPSLYEFQATLSNRSRPDCLIRLPGTRLGIVIDSKFPLECFEALKKAGSEEEKKAAIARVRSDVQKHVNDIAGKYLIAGETQSPAIMFVPSESIYAELHDGFSDVIQKAQRAQVIVVSPNILMLAINTVQTVMKDARMREQASLIQKEVGVLVLDVKRLAERVQNLQRHMNQSEGDLKEILVSSEKIQKKGAAIEAVEFVTAPDAGKLAAQ